MVRIISNGRPLGMCRVRGSSRAAAKFFQRLSVAKLAFSCVPAAAAAAVQRQDSIFEIRVFLLTFESLVAINHCLSLVARRSCYTLYYSFRLETRRVAFR